MHLITEANWVSAYAQENIFMTAKSVQTRTEKEILQLFQEKRSKPQCSENHNKHQNWKNQRVMAIKPKKWSKNCHNHKTENPNTISIINGSFLLCFVIDRVRLWNVCIMLLSVTHEYHASVWSFKMIVFQNTSAGRHKKHILTGPTQNNEDLLGAKLSVSLGGSHIWLINLIYNLVLSTELIS